MPTELTGGFLVALLLMTSCSCDEFMAKSEEPEDDGKSDDVATLLRALKEIVQRRQVGWLTVTLINK